MNSTWSRRAAATLNADLPRWRWDKRTNSAHSVGRCFPLTYANKVGAVLGGRLGWQMLGAHFIHCCGRCVQTAGNTDWSMGLTQCATISADRLCINVHTVVKKEASLTANMPVAHNISFGDSMKSETAMFSVGCCTFQPFEYDFGRQTKNIYHVQRTRNASGAHDGATTKTRRHYSNDTLHVCTPHASGKHR